MATLSPREQDVVRLVALGKTTKEISADLGIAESTVSWHVTNVLGKLEASSRAEAVARALTEGLLDVQRPIEPIAPPKRSMRPRLALSAAPAIVALAVLLGGGLLALAAMGRPPSDLVRLWLPSATTSVAPALTEQPPSASAATATLATPTQSTPPALPTIPAPTAAPALSNAPLPVTTAGAPGVGPLPSVTPLPTVTTLPSLPLPLPTPSLSLP